MSKTGCEYYWFLHGCRPEPSKEIIGYNPEREAYRKSIGNYFKTKEEAEKVVEKLKAWKRLKNKGTRFKEWFWDKNYGTCIILGDSEEHDYVDDTDEQIRKDLDLLFGGEE